MGFRNTVMPFSYPGQSIASVVGLLLLLGLTLRLRISFLGLILGPSFILIATTVLLIRLGKLRCLPCGPLSFSAAALVGLLLNFCGPCQPTAPSSTKKLQVGGFYLP